MSSKRKWTEKRKRDVAKKVITDKAVGAFVGLNLEILDSERLVL